MDGWCSGSNYCYFYYEKKVRYTIRAVNPPIINDKVQSNHFISFICLYIITCQKINNRKRAIPVILNVIRINLILFLNNSLSF